MLRLLAVLAGGVLRLAREAVPPGVAAGQFARLSVEAMAKADAGRGDAVRGRLLDRLHVAQIALALGHQEQVLARLGAAIADRLRHRIRRVPDDVLTQPPACILQREREAPAAP